MSTNTTVAALMHDKDMTKMRQFLSRFDSPEDAVEKMRDKEFRDQIMRDMGYNPKFNIREFTKAVTGVSTYMSTDIQGIAFWNSYFPTILELVHLFNIKALGLSLVQDNA